MWGKKSLRPTLIFVLCYGKPTYIFLGLTLGSQFSCPPANQIKEIKCHLLFGTLQFFPKINRNLSPLGLKSTQSNFCPCPLSLLGEQIAQPKSWITSLQSMSEFIARLNITSICAPEIAKIVIHCVYK